MTPATRSVRIRRATRPDAPQLLSLIKALADFEKLKRPGTEAGKRLVRDCFGRRKRFDAFLAFSGKKAIGYAVILETYSSFLALPTLYLEDLFVLPGERGQGTGLKLFIRCLEEAHLRGCGRMQWVVLDWNKSAVRFYKRIGARHLREWHTYGLEKNQFSKILSGT